MVAIKYKPLSLQILVLAIFVVFATFILQGNKDFSLWDEGFLWYGTQRTMLGEIPIRDFMSYDPGRYYWSATLMSLLNDNGIMALRWTVTIFQTIGLFVGLLLISESLKKQKLIYLLLSALTLVVWMIPRHKLFDISLSILLIGILTFLVQKPTCRRYFITGICVGLTAVFGRNHGVYGIAGSLGVITWLNIRREESGLMKGFMLWVAGIITGFMPILLMALLISGFASAFWESILFLFETKTTNISLPVPWPWLIDSSVPLGEAIRRVLAGLFFIATALFGILSISWVMWQKWHNKQVSPVLVATAFLALPYAHYAYSRADIAHLAQGIFPLLVGCLVILSTQSARIKWSLASVLCAASFWVTFIYHPGWQCYASQQCVDIEISGDNLLVDSNTANDIKLLRQLADQYAPDGQSFIVTPFWPGAYALLERKSPMWESYALFSRSSTFENAEIQRIKITKPVFAIIYDYPLDGQNELRFRNTHPLIHQYIHEHFESLVGYTQNPAYQIYKSK